MPDAAYTFTGYETEPGLGYFSYRDLDTQKMLIAVNGGTYRIAAVEPNLPVPPNDGRWVPVSAAPSGGRRRAAGDTSTPAGDESTGAGE